LVGMGVISSRPLKRVDVSIFGTTGTPIL